jgi:hypothetical protein
VVAVFMTRTIRTVGLLARDRRIPRPLRWVAGLALLPVPGPFDEAVLLLVAVPLIAFYRRPLRDAWRIAGVERQAGDDGPSGEAAGSTTAEVTDVGR